MAQHHASHSLGCGHPLYVRTDPKTRADAAGFFEKPVDLKLLITLLENVTKKSRPGFDGFA